MRLLCTGGAGFIGSHLTDELISAGHKVTILDNLSTGNVSNINCDANFISGNINDVHLLDELFAQYEFDYVFHLAAQINLRKSILDPYTDAETNILGSLAIINKCIEYDVKKLIFSSTGGAIYSIQEPIPFTEDTLCRPASPYGLSKLTVESYLKIMKNLHGLDYVALRYSNVYGPRQNPHGEAGITSIFKDRILSGKNLIINGDGEQTRDFIYVADVVKANILAMNLSGVYNVSSEIETSVNYIAKKILKITGSKSKIEYRPEIAGEMKRCCLNADKLKNETGWKASYSFDEGLLKTMEAK